MLSDFLVFWMRHNARPVGELKEVHRPYFVKKLRWKKLRRMGVAGY